MDGPPRERVLWSMRRNRTDVRCLLRAAAHPPVEVVVLQDRDVVFFERFTSTDVAMIWAEAYASRLRSLGWFDTPSTTPPIPPPTTGLDGSGGD